MLGHRVLTLQDYGTILKRRWWIIAIPAIIFPIIGFGVTFLVQPQYISQTLVLVEQQKVPESYVKAVVTEDLSGRLATMREQILSRSRLQPIIERFNLFANEKMSMDDRIDLTRKNIGIAPIQSEIARTNGLPGFFISFKANDPRTAQLVCGEIQSLFVSENLSDRAASAAGTTDFLKGQLSDAKAKLDEQDAKLAKFQQTYVGKLPGAEASNLNMMASLNTQLDASTQALARMEQEKSYAESILAMQQNQLAQTPEHGGLAPQAQQIELQRLQAEEADLSARYTDDYPDVVSVRRKINELQQKMAKAPPPPTTPSLSTPKPNDPLSVQQLRAQLRAMDQGIVQKKHDQAAIQAQLRMYQERVSSSPAVEEEYKSITRDNQTAQSFYDDLLGKMNQSKMATDLEKRQQGEQFRVMDEPNLPESPASPKRPVFVMGGLAAGLGLGLLIVALLEYLDTAVRNERDIWAFTKLPTLGVIAFNGGAEQMKMKRTWFGRRTPDLTAGPKPLMNAGAEMYNSFFKLQSSPFGTSPDPRFLYMMPHTREALACLEYGISARKGFTVLTGEVGTGKTTLLRRALSSFSNRKVSTAFVFNPRLDVLDFLEFVMTDFGIVPATRTKSGMLLQLNRWLIERFRMEETCVVVVDEAQNLSWDLLEEIRLLTNLETSSEKLLQIVLSGQPELEEKLRHPSVRQLRQRSLWCRTQALTESQTHAYVAERLRIAGASWPLFSLEALDLIHRCSRGIPRIINLLCEHSLIVAYVEQVQQVTPAIVEGVATELELETQPFMLSSAALGNGNPSSRRTSKEDDFMAAFNRETPERQDR